MDLSKPITLLNNIKSKAMTYNEWIEYLRNERKKIAEKLERMGDKPVMSAQERQRIADKTRTTIHNQ